MLVFREIWGGGGTKPGQVMLAVQSNPCNLTSFPTSVIYVLVTKGCGRVYVCLCGLCLINALHHH